jgi:hypothetical protein
LSEHAQFAGIKSQEEVTSDKKQVGGDITKTRVRALQDALDPSAFNLDTQIVFDREILESNAVMNSLSKNNIQVICEYLLDADRVLQQRE